MKFYTLDFDCNAPVTQQVNVPTNTDYKVGIKVKRNGAYQNLKPAEVKLYTGELSAIAPSEFDFVDREVDSGTGVSFLLSYNETTQTNISALYNQPVKCTDIYVESSTDNGVTWAKTIPSGPQYMRINDRSAGTNNYVAQKDLSDPDSKFELITGGYVTGTADEITLPSIVRFAGNFNTDSWQNTVRPCQMRLVINYGGKTVQLYISPDEDDVNGYTTFTMSAGDNASYTQDVLDIQHAQDSTVEIQKYTNETGAQVSRPGLSCTAEELGLTGKTIYPDMVKMGATYALNEQPTDAELKAEADTYWNWTFRTDTPSLIFRTSVMISGTQGVIYSMTGDPAGAPMYKQALLDAGQWDGVTPIFFFVPPGSGNIAARYSYTFDGSETIVYKNVKLGAGKSNGGYLELDYDLPFDAKFKLNTNIFKSQQGDQAESVENASTAKLTGVYSDGTEFDYDIVIA